MQKAQIKLQWENNQDFFLRTVVEKDLEDLRLWKNQNKQFFFHQSDITVEQQKNWFDGFQKRTNDFMFIVEQVTDHQSIGCMGFRFLEKDGIVDVYNIMRGVRTINNSFSMSDAFQTMINYILRLTDLSITCKVLSNNPALDWYHRNYFETVECIDNFHVLKLGKKNFPIKSLLVTEIEDLYYRV